MLSGTPKKTIEFNRPKKYRPVKILGHGACGQTMLVHDDEMDIALVAKKYAPIVSKSTDPIAFNDLMGRFRDEARILFQLNHPNIVRVYNFFDYSEIDTAYIIMEHVSGLGIIDYIKKYPDAFDSVFERTIAGFEHLEDTGILHRDIRPTNLLVSDAGEPKIIDFGFGKRIDLAKSQQDKSISLNWWCETPPEFAQSVYDHQTELYFVGKLFEEAAKEAGLTAARHKHIVDAMCQKARGVRPKSFKEIAAALNRGRLDDIDFSPDEIEVYQAFSDALSDVFKELDPTATLSRDAVAIMAELETLFKAVRLERTMPDPVKLARIFVKGAFVYFKTKGPDIGILKDFVELMRSLSDPKREIVIANLHTRIDAIPKSRPKSPFDDEIPF